MNWSVKSQNGRWGVDIAILDELCEKHNIIKRYPPFDKTLYPVSLFTWKRGSFHVVSIEHDKDNDNMGVYISDNNCKVLSGTAKIVIDEWLQNKSHICIIAVRDGAIIEVTNSISRSKKLIKFVVKDGKMSYQYTDYSELGPPDDVDKICL